MTLNMLHRHTIMRVLEIDAGHRLYQHEGKCKHLHGHRYRFQIYFTSGDLDKLGRVVDFGEVKRRIGGWLETNWDHGMILNAEDPVSSLYKIDWTKYTFFGVPEEKAHLEINQMKYFLLPCNPTAENLASYLLTVSNQLMQGTEVSVSKVECWETPNCMAVAEL